MKTLAQIRAQNALKCAEQKLEGENEGDIVNKIPSLIQNNGLMAALAFCYNKSKKDKEKGKDKGEGKDKGAGYRILLNFIVDHLSHPEINITKSKNIDDFMNELSNGDAYLLRRATHETLAFLNYVKRFAK
jgi:CRISPR type III-B/RAMP module-associated protein Cmr5